MFGMRQNRTININSRELDIEILKLSSGSGSYYERNLETWRQLWRTLEMSDVILFVCDIRYPTLHFSPAVYKGEFCFKTK